MENIIFGLIILVVGAAIGVSLGGREPSGQVIIVQPSQSGEGGFFGALAGAGIFVILVLLILRTLGPG